MIYLHKILPLIFSPLFFIVSLIIIGLIFRSKKLCITGILILLVSSMPIVSGKMTTYLESNYAPNKPSEVKTANAIVVLSGMVRAIETKSGLNYEWNGNVDRFFAGVNLFKLNKAPTLIFTGGKLPWSIGVPEGEYLKNMAIKFGVPEKNILLTENIENTDQEAKAIKKLFSKDNHQVILVTSAFHMPRAKLVFKAAGVNLIPYPVDFKSASEKLTFMSFIPSAGGFAGTSAFVREMIGRTYYNLKY